MRSALQTELLAALASDEGRDLLSEIVSAAVAAALAKIPPAPTPDDLLSVDDAAKVRGCTVAALRKLIQRDRIPSVRVGRTVRVRRSDVLGVRP